MLAWYNFVVNMSIVYCTMICNMDPIKLKELLKFFHGDNYTEEEWKCRESECCALCKTQNSTGKHRHWANELCRSCYRRLSPAHRLYNDISLEKSPKPTLKTKKKVVKKEYKSLALESILFDAEDIRSLLERYEFKCAYCKVQLQDYDHTLANAFQLEYVSVDEGKLMLIPSCRSCNCSKKNLAGELKLRRWSRERGVDYPFKYILPQKK